MNTGYICFIIIILNKVHVLVSNSQPWQLNLLVHVFYNFKYFDNLFILCVYKFAI